MYCKFCGSEITSDAGKCVICGAKIDLNDGGQSFFDDFELNAWKSTGGIPCAGVPKTEMRAALPATDGNKIEETKALYPGASVGERKTRKHSKKGAIVPRLKLSSSNKLIIFCIAVVLAIVLLVVAILAGVNNVGENEEGQAQPQETEVKTETTDQKATTVPNDTQPPKEELPEKKEAPIDDGENREWIEIKGVSITKDNKPILDEMTTFYDVGGVIYVGIEDILLYEGYKPGEYIEATKSYRFNTIEPSDDVVEVMLDSDTIYLKLISDGGKAQKLNNPMKLFENKVYVPAIRFLELFGYTAEFDEERKTLDYHE